MRMSVPICLQYLVLSLCVHICLRDVNGLHMLACLWSSNKIVFLQLMHIGKPEIIFSAPHDGALIQFKQLQGDRPLITYGDLGVCLCS